MRPSDHAQYVQIGRKDGSYSRIHTDIDET